MDELYICSCAQRRLFGRTMPTEPSLFLREIPEEAVRVVGTRPRAFGRSSLASAGGSTSATLGVSADGLWRVGGRLFHDDYGYGVIASLRESEDGPIVFARFETGKEVRFLPRYQAASFMRIGSDE
jgi:DNA helicase-2/ATP-dependent DNA helicase PcrA